MDNRLVDMGKPHIDECKLQTLLVGLSTRLKGASDMTRELIEGFSSAVPMLAAKQAGMDTESSRATKTTRTRKHLFFVKSLEMALSSGIRGVKSETS